MKKVIVLILALALVLATTACASTHPVTNQTITTQTATTDTTNTDTHTNDITMPTTKPEDSSAASTSEAEEIDDGDWQVFKSPDEYEHKIPDFDHPEEHAGIEYVDVLGILLQKDTLPTDLAFPTEPTEMWVAVGEELYPEDPHLADLQARALTVRDTIMSYCLWNGVDSLPSAFTGYDGETLWATTCWYEDDLHMFFVYFGEDDGFRSYDPWSQEQQEKRKAFNEQWDSIFTDGVVRPA